MKWAKYFGLLLLSFCLFFGLSPLKQVKAATLNSLSNYSNTVIVQYNGSRYNVYSDSDSWQSHSNYYLLNNNRLTGIEIRPNTACFITNWYSNFNPLQNPDTDLSVSDTATFFDLNNSLFVTPYKGSLFTQGNNTGNIYNSFEDYLDSIAPSWWENVKSAFMNFVGSEALSDVLSGDWLSYIDDVLFGDLWTVKVGEGEDDMIIPETVSATPSPSPTPIPTQIPYSTVIDPGTGEIHYHYTIDVSGTPVPTSSIYPPVTSSPTGPGSGSTIDEPVAVEDYYEPEDSLSVPKLRIFKFLLRMTGNDVDIGMDSLDYNMAVMDATIEDNAEAISSVSDLFQLIPVKWFILIGTLACFPVIAAMIKSLLGG